MTLLRDFLIHTRCSGGGNRANSKLDRRTPSLLWMRNEATLAGLALLPLNPISLNSRAKTQLNGPTVDANKREDKRIIETTESLSFWSIWWLLEIMPLFPWKSHMPDKKAQSNFFITTYILTFWWWFLKITQLNSSKYTMWVLYR